MRLFMHTLAYKRIAILTTNKIDVNITQQRLGPTITAHNVGLKNSVMNIRWSVWMNTEIHWYFETYTWGQKILN